MAVGFYFYFLCLRYFISSCCLCLLCCCLCLRRLFLRGCLHVFSISLSSMSIFMLVSVVSLVGYYKSIFRSKSIFRPIIFFVVSLSAFSNYILQLILVVSKLTSFVLPCIGLARLVSSGIVLCHVVLCCAALCGNVMCCAFLSCLVFSCLVLPSIFVVVWSGLI